MPTNLYGPGDNYHPDDSHVLPALVRRVHEAKREGAPTVTVWGTGSPRREFLFVDDLADACVFALEHYTGESQLNVGSGEEVTIADAAKLVGEVIGYKGNLVFDTSRPDGTQRKFLDSSKLMEMGWQPRTSLRDGLKLAYSEFVARFSEDLRGHQPSEMYGRSQSTHATRANKAGVRATSPSQG
jgi:GDP-L-fucose synthase